eukprot:scaffold6070_cov295-Pinguiococcus_pyrenoidosus.AAC.11
MEDEGGVLPFVGACASVGRRPWSQHRSPALQKRKQQLHRPLNPFGRTPRTKAWRSPRKGGRDEATQIAEP